MDGVSIDDVAGILKDENESAKLADDIEALSPKIEKLGLSNFERATVNGNIQILTIISRMPEPEVKMFWTIMERLNQIAGVGSLIIAIIALRLAR
jgi:hypothetical protein